jgi:5'-3' exonuclease
MAHGPGRQVPMRALLVDGLNLVRRIYAAVPGEEGSPGHFEGVLRSCRASLARALNAHPSSHAICVMDDSGRGWRHELFPGYKRDRPPMPAPLARGLGEIGTRFQEAGVPVISIPGFEADDVLATVARRIAEHDGAALILSTDQSMCQLLSPRIGVYDHFANRHFDVAYVHQRFGVSPARLPVLWGLAGVSSVGFPGVPSVGLKTAARLINEHGDLEAILHAASGMPGKLGAALRAGADSARLGQRLFTLRVDVRVGLNLRQLRYIAPAH